MTKAKHPGGRPTSYSQEVYDTALDYLDTYKSKYDHEFPSVVGLCRVLNLSKTTLYRWAGKDEDTYHEEFGAILEDLNNQQQLVLLSNGVNGKFNAQITKLVLGKHGYHDKQDTEVTGSGGGPIENKWVVEVVDAPKEIESAKPTDT